MKKMFNKILGRPVDSFDRVDEMVTRKLPIPDLEGTDKYVQFIAKRTKEGYWTIAAKNNIKSITSGYQTIKEAFPTAVKKHIGAEPTATLQQTYNFDTAFLILKDLEESLLKYSGVTLGDNPKDEPERHYMTAYRLLPRQFQEGLDDLFSSRTAAKGEILPAKKDTLRTETAAKDHPARGPKPN